MGYLASVPDLGLHGALAAVRQGGRRSAPRQECEQALLDRAEDGAGDNNGNMVW